MLREFVKQALVNIKSDTPNSVSSFYDEISGNVMNNINNKNPILQDDFEIYIKNIYIVFRKEFA